MGQCQNIKDSLEDSFYKRCMVSRCKCTLDEIDQIASLSDAAQWTRGGDQVEIEAGLTLAQVETESKD